MAPRATLDKRTIAQPLWHHVEDLCVADRSIRRNANMLATWGHDPMALLTPAQRAEMSELEKSFRQAGLNPPPSQDSDLMQLLRDTDALISLHNVALKQTLTFHADTINHAAHSLATAFPAARAFTTSQARGALNTSRRVIVPLLEHFDSLGLTIRQGDRRQIVAQNVVSPTPPP